MAMLFSCDLPVFRGCIEASMSQVFLEQPEAIPRVIYLHRVYGESVSEAMGADATGFACLGIYQMGQPCLLAAFPHNLPGTVAVYAEDESFPTAYY